MSHHGIYNRVKSSQALLNACEIIQKQVVALTAIRKALRMYEVSFASKVANFVLKHH